MRVSRWLLFVFLTGCSTGSRDASAKYDAAFQQFLHGDLAKTLELADSGLQSLAKAPQSEAYWKFRLLKAEALMPLGKAKDALPLLSEPAPAGLPEIDTRRQVDLANATWKLGHPDEALAILDRARPQPGLLAQAEILRGAILISRNPALAEQTLESAVTHASQDQQPYYEASALINISTLNFRRSHFEDALEFAKRALALAEPIQARVIVGAAYGNIASNYLWLGDFDHALEFRQRALAYQRSTGNEQHIEESLGDIGNLHFLADDFAASLPYYEQAYDMSYKDKLLADASKWAGNLASSCAAIGQWDKAAVWVQRARELKVQSGEKPSLDFIQMLEAQIAEGHGNLPDAERIYKELVGKPRLSLDLEWETRAGLGRVYAEEKRFPEGYREFSKALATIDELRAEVRDPAARISFLSRLIHFYQDYVSVLTDEGDDARAMAVVEASRARVLAERLGRTMDKLAAPFAKPSGTILLSYWIAPKRSFVWMVNASGVKRFELPPAKELEPLVAAHRKAVEDDLADPVSIENGPSFQLSKAVLGPVLALIPSGAKVVIVPDGVLHRVNFETLPIAGPKPHYWIEDVVLSIAPSLSVLANAPAARAGGAKSLLLFGAPTTADPLFPTPSYAAQESSNVQKYFNGAKQVFTGAAATPDAYKSGGPERFDLIHFAAHAEASQVSPLDSSVILARGRDGFRLYVREVASLPLRADVVTVSSCSGAGVKTYKGEGLIGFAWAFLGAGARSVIAGLWDVNDNSTASLMDSMYGEIAEGREAAVALHDAKLKVMASGGNFRKPYYWGPFQHYTRSVTAAPAYQGSYPARYGAPKGCNCAGASALKVPGEAYATELSQPGFSSLDAGSDKR